jgi:putative ABC transport system substrate-binding protein
MAAELVSRPVAVLTSSGGEPAARAAMAATSTIPIVANFSIDPVARGFVKSLNRPGGNVTGVSNFTSSLEPKRLSLFRLLLPNVATFGVLLNPSFVDSERQLNELGDAARVLGLQIRELRASTDSEIDAAFASLARLGVSALFVQGDPYFFARRDKITGLAASYAVPAVYGYRDYAAAGGLMSYGIDLADIYRQNAIYVGRILRGAKPTELPVVQPTKFEFVINLKTAKALGTKFSDDLLSIADEVIE